MLKLSDVRKNFSFKIQIGMSDFSIAELARNMYDTELDYDVYLPTKNKNLQRPFVWTLEQKQELIISILKGIRLPSLSIYVCKVFENGLDKTIYRVIDGKQRLSTIISFYKNEFSIDVNENSYFYNELEKEAQYEIHNAPLTYNKVYYRPHITDDELIDWYEMLNFKGTKQDEKHLEYLRS